MWNCFWMLAPSRPIVTTGMTAQQGRLPYAEISAWAKDHGYDDDPDALDEFVALVQVMDTKWLQLHAPKKGK